LGNLFRRRGEFDRAVRVHEHLLGRADLKPVERDRAQLALAQDFMKAGLFDRAEGAWLSLKDTAHDADAQLALLSLYERSRDWPQAAAVARKLSQGANAGEFGARIAHYECELAESAQREGNLQAAEAALHRAVATAPQLARAQVQRGHLAMALGQPLSAWEIWEQLRLDHPQAFVLVADAYAAAASAAHKREEAIAGLTQSLQQLPAVELLRALHNLQDAPDKDSLPRLLQHLQQHPSLSAAQLLLEVPADQWTPQAWQALREAVANSATPLQHYRCSSCGFVAKRYFWQCPGCLSWDSFPTQRADALVAKETQDRASQQAKAAHPPGASGQTSDSVSGVQATAQITVQTTAQTTAQTADHTVAQTTSQTAARTAAEPDTA
jgi:lipopolysaccharide biosynthesis regulator YciM